MLLVGLKKKRESFRPYLGALLPTLAGVWAGVTRFDRKGKGKREGYQAGEYAAPAFLPWTYTFPASSETGFSRTSEKEGEVGGKGRRGFCRAQACTPDLEKITVTGRTPDRWKLPGKKKEKKKKENVNYHNLLRLRPGVVNLPRWWRFWTQIPTALSSRVKREEKGKGGGEKGMWIICNMVNSLGRCRPYYSFPWDAHPGRKEKKGEGEKRKAHPVAVF